jgi:aspartyl-tRNA(Asn)/glutamyl-tRNA(Gln) amidotransferase subunit B
MSTTPAGWEVVIGLETHTQLSTVSKIFSGSPTTFGAAPNTQANVVDLALPGTLPVLNRGAVEKAIMFGLAVNGTIASHSVFARKNYFYPDLPKGYQISQFELPVVVGGKVPIVLDGVEKTVQLTRAHLEEDAGKSLHEGLDTMGVSGIDLNRAGTPLLEIVTEPDMRSAAEAVVYAKALHGLVTWLGICDGNMQEGSFRCDANVSVRPKGQQEYGTRCEIKNVNSFKFLERAIEYEIRRQIELIEDGGRVVQETRLYDADRDETRSMRSKEDAMDYRYFPDPDLLPLVIDAAWIERVKAGMQELPEAMCERLKSQYGLPAYDARTITADHSLAQYFEHVVVIVGMANAKLTSNWMLGELSAMLNEQALSCAQSPIKAPQFATLIQRIADGTVSAKTAKDLLHMIARGDAREDVGGDFPANAADVLIERLGLEQVSDAGAIEKIVDEVIAANQKSVDEFKSGKEKAFQALVGQVMKASKGKANPAQVNEILKKKLSS